MKLLIAFALAFLTPFAAAQTPKGVPKMVVQTGHAEYVRSVAFSPDGTLFASGSNDNTVKIWDVASRRELRTLTGHSDHVLSIQFSRDGRLLASLGYDNSVCIWEVQSGQAHSTIHVENGTSRAIAFTADGKMLLTANGTDSGGSGDHLIRCWDLATGKVARTLDPGEVMSALAISRDGNTLAMGGLSGAIKVWDLSTNRERASLAGHTDEVQSIDLSPNGTTLASGSKDGTARLWDLGTGKPPRVLKHRDIVTAVALSPDGKTLATGCWDHAVHLWDVAGGTETRALRGHKEIVWGVAFAPDGRTLASSSSDKALKLWEVATGSERLTFAGHVDFVEGVVLANKGKTLISHDSWDAIRVWDLASGKDMRRIAVAGDLRAFETMTATDDGFIGANENGLITLYDRDGKPLRTLDGHNLGLNALAASPDGKLLASGGSERWVRVWSLADGKLMATLDHPDTEGFHIESLAFSPDSRRLAMGTSRAEVRVAELPSGKELFVKADPEETGFILGLAYSPDGATIAAATGTGKVRLLDAATGATIRAFGEGLSQAVVFSTDGKHLWTGSADGTITLWNTSDGTSVRTLAGHAGYVTSLLLRGNGKTLISSSRDSTVKVWDTASGDALATLVAFDHSDWLVITPDGLFDGTSPAYSQILWRFSSELRDVAPVEVFFGDFFYPNLLSDLMGGKRPKAGQSVAQKDRRQAAVQLQLASPASGRTVDVDVRITEAPAGAQDVRLFRNGSLVKVWHGDVLDGSAQTVLKASLPIVAGDNRLTAYAFNHDNVKSADATLLVQGAASLRHKGTAHVLAVGVNSYANKDFDLKYAVADAGSFGAEWKAQQETLGTFAQTLVMSLTDDQATKRTSSKRWASWLRRWSPRMP
jgi:WD40 repeat protein